MTRPWHPSHTPSVVRLAAATVATQGVHGAVTDLARESGVRRQTIYDLRERAEEALRLEFAPAEPRPRGAFTREMAPSDVERVIVALRVHLPCSIRDIVTILPVLYGVHWSYGSVWDVLHRAEQRAASWLPSVNLSGVHHIAADEMFSQGLPVLASIDLDSQYLTQLEVQDDRSGETWAKSFGKLRDDQKLMPKSVTKDAGTGLGAGVRACWPTADELDDIFHAAYKLGKEAYHLERSAYRAIGVVDDLEKRRARATTEKVQALDEQLREALEHMEAAILRYDQFEKLRREVDRILDLCDRGTGRLRTSADVLQALTRIAAEMAALGGKRIVSAAKYLGNRAAGLGRYLDDLGARIAKASDAVGSVEVVEAAVRACQASISIDRGGPSWDKRAREREMKDATRHLLDVTDREPARLQQVLGTVIHELVRRHRASSAIENLNSVLRPYLVVQKHAEQGFLNLFRFYWNTRMREWGRGKGTSALEELTGRKVEDWLSLLGFPPSRLIAAAA